MALGGATREFMLRIVADVHDATKGMEQVEKSSSNMKSTVMGIGKAVGGALAVGAVVDFGKQSVQAAAEAEQAMNGVKAVFGDSADQIEEFSSKAITSMGISDDAYQQFATSTGGLLKDMGVPLDTTIGMTDELAQRGADLAAVYGVDAEQAFTAMQKAMGGSYKGLRQLGIQLDKNEVEAYAMSKGWVDAEGSVTDAGKAMATQQLIMQKTADKAGQFAEHSGEVANQQKILALQFEETKETIGTALLPTIQNLMGAMVPLLEFTAKYADILVPIAGVILAIVAANKLYAIGEAAVTTAKTVGTAAQWAFNAAMAANPIGLIVIAITAIIAAIVLLYMKVDWFRDAVDKAIDGIVAAWNWLLEIIQKVFDWVKENWPLLLAIITGPFGAAVAIIIKNWDSIKEWFGNLFGWFGEKFGSLKESMTKPFREAWDYIKQIPQWVEDKFYGLTQSIARVFKGVEDAIKLPFKWAFEAIKWLWNTTIGGLKVNIPGWGPVPGWHFTVPEMAEGGIVNRPTLAMIGEAGPEAVVPLDKGGFGNTYNVNVYALNANAETGRLIAESLREYNRTTGFSVART